MTILLAGALMVGTLAYVIRLILRAGPVARWAFGVIIVFLGFQVFRFLPGPFSELLVSHVFGAEEGLLHIHIIELFELASLIIVGVLACSSPSQFAGSSR